MAWVVLFMVAVVIVIGTVFIANRGAGDSVDIDINDRPDVIPSSAATSSISASSSEASSSASGSTL